MFESSCDDHFGPGGAYAGYYDFTCGHCVGLSCADCSGVPNGDSVEDECGTYDADSSNDCTEDCQGAWGGTAVNCDDGSAQCTTQNLYDASLGSGGCDTLIAAGYSCDYYFPYGGIYAAYCDFSCEYNMYDTYLGSGECAALINPITGSFTCDIFEPGAAYGGYCDFECGFCGRPCRGRSFGGKLSNYGTCATPEPPPHAKAHRNMLGARVGGAYHVL